MPTFPASSRSPLPASVPASAPASAPAADPSTSSPAGRFNWPLLALAIGAFGEVYAGGLASGDKCAFAILGS